MTDMRDLDRWPGYSEQSWSQRFAELDKQHAALGRKLVGITQIHAATISMLGPKGREVVKMWHDKGVVGLHFSWGPEGARTSGEERAQLHLDIEKACESAELIENVDSHLKDSQ